MSTDATRSPRSVINVGFSDAVPRRGWGRAEVSLVLAALALAAVACLVTALYQRAAYDRVDAADQRVNVQRRLIAARVAPLRVLQANLQSAGSRTASVDAQRQSGLRLVSEIVHEGDAIGGDGVATSISSNGTVQGIAPSLDAITRIWQRLGDSKNLNSARPQGDGIIFNFSPAQRGAGQPPAAMTPQQAGAAAAAAAAARTAAPPADGTARGALPATQVFTPAPSASGAP